MLNPIYPTWGGYYGDSSHHKRADLFLFSAGQWDSVMGVLCAGGAVSTSHSFSAGWLWSPPLPAAHRSLRSSRLVPGWAASLEHI